MGIYVPPLFLSESDCYWCYVYAARLLPFKTQTSPSVTLAVVLPIVNTGVLLLRYVGV